MKKPATKIIEKQIKNTQTIQYQKKNETETEKIILSRAEKIMLK